MQGKQLGQVVKRVDVDAELDVSRARLDTMHFCKQVGFNKNNQHYITTAVSELASNIVNHSEAKGYIELSLMTSKQCLALYQQFKLFTEETAVNLIGVEVKAIDYGVGIKDIDLAIKDGYTTKPSSLGYGLPGVKRIMDAFKYDSSTQGTHITCWKFECLKQ